MIVTNKNVDVNLCISCNRFEMCLYSYFGEHFECDEYEYKSIVYSATVNFKAYNKTFFTKFDLYEDNIKPLMQENTKIELNKKNPLTKNLISWHFFNKNGELI